MEEKYIQQLKKIYSNEKVSDHQVFVSWENLKHRLPEQEVQKPFYQQYRYIFAGVVLFLVIGAVGVVQAATPNHPLYQMKVTMDNTVAKMLNKPELSVDNRTNDVIKAAKQSPKQLPSAVNAYQKTVQQSTNNAKQENSAEKSSYKENLSEQENKLKSITPTSGADKQLINTAITETEHAKQEVKGAATSNNSENEQHNSNNNANNRDGNNGNEHGNANENSFRKQ